MSFWYSGIVPGNFTSSNYYNIFKIFSSYALPIICISLLLILGVLHDYLILGNEIVKTNIFI